MSPSDQPAPSVRVEFGEMGPDVEMPPIEPGRQSRGATGKRALLIAVVALVAVVGVIMALSRSPGSTAAGTPITTTTVPPETTEAPVTVAPDTETESNTNDDGTDDALSVDPISRYESAESPFLAFNVVAADFGWFVHGFDEKTSEGALYRSPDGLNWDRLPLEGVPDGLVVGFERIGDSFVIAIDARNAWNDVNGADPNLSEYEISFWISGDAVNWIPAPGRPTLSGEGFPYPVLLSETVSLVPVVGQSGDSSSEVVEYLSQIMSAELAELVCDADERPVVGSEAIEVVFIGCDGETVVVLSQLDASALLDGNGRPPVGECITELRFAGQQQIELRYVGIDGTTESVDLGSNFAPFGALAGNTFLSSVPPELGGQRPIGCLPPDEEAGNSGVLRWSPEDGLELIGLPQAVNLAQFFGGVTVASDGRAYIAGEFSVLAASPPYTDWEALEIAPAPAGESTNGAEISIAPDGSVFMANNGSTWLFAHPDDEEWTEVEARSRDFGTVLLAGEDFVIVEVQRGDTTLVKVPLS